MRLDLPETGIDGGIDLVKREVCPAQGFPGRRVFRFRRHHLLEEIDSRRVVAPVGGLLAGARQLGGILRRDDARQERHEE